MPDRIRLEACLAPGEYPFRNLTRVQPTAPGAVQRGRRVKLPPIREMRPPRTPDASYRFGDFAVSPSERQLYCLERPVALPPKVFDALLLFVRNAERLVRRAELIDALWPDVHVTDANLTNVIVTLRKVLGSTFLDVGAAADSLRMVQRARAEGLTSSFTLEHDPAFAALRRHPKARRR